MKKTPITIDDEKNKKNSFGKTVVLPIILLLITVFVCYAVYSFVFYKPDAGNDIGGITFDTSGLVIETLPPIIETTPGGETTQAVPPVPDEETFNFLVLGRDVAGANTDVIMLVNYKVTQKKIAVMQIPRDTYVETEDFAFKINALYSHYYEIGRQKKVSDPEDYALKEFSKLLEQNLCINIHYYATVNIEGFKNIVDILGGVEVDIPADMYYVDEEQGLTINLKKGKQLLNGDKAEGFVRYRAGYVQADIGRLDAQKIFMSALLKEVKDHFNVSTIIKIANEVFKNVKTDVSLNDMIYFAKNLLSVELSDMAFMSMTGYSPTPPADCAWFYVMNRQGVLNLINEHFNVYNFKITDAIFDKNRIFTSTGDAYYLNPYYIAPPETMIGGKVDSAGDIVGGSINIPTW